MSDRRAWTHRVTVLAALERISYELRSNIASWLSGQDVDAGRGDAGGRGAGYRGGRVRAGDAQILAPAHAVSITAPNGQPYRR